MKTLRARISKLEKKIDQKDCEDQMLAAAADYLHSKGWYPLVISADRIQTADRLGNYELVLRFTGARRQG